ncbi:hypothetical protein [Streptomyces sp. SID10815]|uniref:hypothetical protein n=1 Tax=Streptomyces sp. SID10815 TaxID=2706027 RepID=UPI0013CA8B05|nr:hypothetical protein [Streptomyces sp. SID10815]NEA50893.1 hypothetical protein [Streptomyces sp. SID10815]
MTHHAVRQDTARTARWIDVLARQFPDLLAELAPGGGRPGITAGRSRSSGGGSGSAPVRLHVSDALRDITDGVIELEEAVRDRLGLGRAPRAGVPERLRRLARLLDRVADHPDLARHVLDECRRMARRGGRVLGAQEAMVRVDGRCPWCDSVSLRALPAGRVVLCVNPGCRCTAPGCACADDAGHRHSWEESAWARLADDSGADAAAITALVDAAEGRADDAEGVA